MVFRCLRDRLLEQRTDPGGLLHGLFGQRGPELYCDNWRHKRDYSSVNNLFDAITVLEQLPLWFEDYNENHPHKDLKWMSPREYKKLMDRVH